jgi:hypothetical protein
MWGNLSKIILGAPPLAAGLGLLVGAYIHWVFVGTRRLRLLLGAVPVFALCAYHGFVIFQFSLETEVREGAIWLHVLALRAGVDIYDFKQVAFIHNHGPGDALIKYGVSRLMPFLESWQVMRIGLLLYVPVLAVLVHQYTRKGRPVAALADAVLWGPLVFLLGMSIDPRIFLVGRSDATLYVLFALILALGGATLRSTRKSQIRFFTAGFLWALMVFVNMRAVMFLPYLAFLFAYHCIWKSPRPLRDLAWTSAGGAACVTWVIGWFFHFDLRNYVLRFVKTWDPRIGHGTFPLPKFEWFPEALHTLPLLFLSLFSLAALGLLWQSLASTKRKLFLLLGYLSSVASSYALSAVAYFRNGGGGGIHYFVPTFVGAFSVLVIYFVSTDRRRVAYHQRLRAVAVGFALPLSLLDGTLRQANEMRELSPAAAEFTRTLRKLNAHNEVYSEDLFLFKQKYAGELVDMPDVAEWIYAKKAFGPDFAKTMEAQKARFNRAPPALIFNGFLRSSWMQQKLDLEYARLSSSPKNLQFNCDCTSTSYVRKDRHGDLVARY